MLGQRGDSDQAAAAGDATPVAGRAVDVTVLEASSMGRTNETGVGMYAVALLVGRPAAARQTVVSSAVPSDCLGLLDGGTTLPARILDADPDAIVIDWDRARRQHADTPDAEI